MDWANTLAEIRRRKLEIAAVDPSFRPVRPSERASEAAIALAEARLGWELPSSYRVFLAAHDGWHDFYHGANLLSACELSEGAHVDAARVTLERCERPLPEFALAALMPREDASMLVPFGIDARRETVFAWNVAARTADGELEILVWVNGIGERVGSFGDLLGVVLELLNAELEAKWNARARRESTGPSSGTRLRTRSRRAVRERSAAVPPIAALLGRAS